MASKIKKARKPATGTELLQLVRADKRARAIAAGELHQYGMVGQIHAPSKAQQRRRDRREGRTQARNWE